MKSVWLEAWSGLLRNRGRAALATLGISWGIVSVVVLLAYGEGFGQAIEGDAQHLPHHPAFEAKGDEAQQADHGHFKVADLFG